MPSNPLAGNSDPNARRIVAHGFRNPFRFTLRPGTSELWIGDVGWGDWEEIDRLVSPTAGVTNFGWPCYEGNSSQPGYDSANLSICETMYSAGNVDTKPFFTYNHAAKVVPGESCATGSSSISGLAFESSAPVRSFPAAYQNALYFADYSRKCIWVMKAGAGGVPSTSQIETFAAGANGPVWVTFGPDGNLYYADFDGGTIRKISPSGATPPPTSNSYLSDLTWSSMTNGWGPIEKDKSNGENGAADGHTLTLNGTTYAKGLGTHAISDVRYALGSNCTRFKASVGIDDEVGTRGHGHLRGVRGRDQDLRLGRDDGRDRDQGDRRLHRRCGPAPPRRHQRRR